jgi:pimeloyl-ACP methyl ester carboxylesterase
MGSADMWSAVAPKSGWIGWQVYTAHLPGHHRDYVLPNEYTISSFADCILNQIHFSPSDTLILIGHSMGGYIAADIAARFPDQTHSLVLFHSKVSNDSESKKTDRARAIDLSEANTSLYISTMLRNTFSPVNLARLKTGLEELIISAQQRVTHECIKACHTAMMNRNNYSAVFDTGDIRRYYFLGSDDNAIPFSGLQNELSNVPNENVWLVDGIGHMGHIESPEASRLFLESALRDH